MSRGKGQGLGSIFADLRRDAPAPPPARASLSAFLSVVDRVEAVVDAETAALARALPADMTEIGHRKRQGLLDMTRTLKAASADGPRPEIGERLNRFARALDRNGAALGTRLRAVREVADIVAQAIREAESDGTYSPRGPRP